MSTSLHPLDSGILDTHCRHSWGSSSHPHSQEAAGAAEVDLWEKGRGELGSLPNPESPLMSPILPTSFLSSGSSTFSSRRSGQSLLLLGVGLGCFWRRMYSTKGEADSK